MFFIYFKSGIYSCLRVWAHACHSGQPEDNLGVHPHLLPYGHRVSLFTTVFTEWMAPDLQEIFLSESHLASWSVLENRHLLPPLPLPGVCVQFTTLAQHTFTHGMISVVPLLLPGVCVQVITFAQFAFTSGTISLVPHISRYSVLGSSGDVISRIARITGTHKFFT